MKLSLAVVYSIVVLVTLLAFPKAGIYVSGTPLTLGYFLLAGAGLFQAINLANNRQQRMPANYFLLGTMFLLLGVVELAAFSYYGVVSVGQGVSIVASTIIVPVLSMLSVHWMIGVLGWERFMKTLRICLVIVFLFGVASFFAYNLGGKLIGIPFVTTTGGDLSLIAERHNLRGSIIKMFSTYNNGNILGINLLLWGALVALTSKWSLFQVRSICILTLSRSAWLGLAMLEIFNSIARRSVRKMFYATFSVLALFLIVIAASTYIGRDPTSFILDRDLGGRVTTFQRELHSFSNASVGWSNESLYAAAYLALGPFGTLLISAIWAVPVLRGGSSKLQIECRIILLVYLIVAAAEAAFNLVPTQACYWMVAGIAMGAGSDEANEEFRMIEKESVPSEMPSQNRAA